MARRTIQAGYLARRIEELRATGLTRREVAAQTGIGERTQRKLISGETSGRHWYRRIIPTPSRTGMGPRGPRRPVDIPFSTEPGHFSVVVRNPDGSYSRIPLILRDYEHATHLTVFDKARILSNPDVQAIVRAEILKRYPGATGPRLDQAQVVDVVPIIHSHTAEIPMVWLG